jgi:transcriptional regulator with GAF, ATPase, and Fis domain
MEYVVSADLAVILSRRTEELLEVTAYRGRLSTPSLEGYKVDLSHLPSLSEALRGRQPVLMHEAHDEGEPDTYEGALTLPGDHSCLVVPLRAGEVDRADGPLLGALTLDAVRCDAFSPDQLRAVEGFAYLATQLLAAWDKADRLERDLNVLALENSTLRGTTTAGLVGTSPTWQAVLDRVRLVAPTQANVLVQGETGTGKEQVARAIHERSTRAKGPFIAVNCSVLTGDLVMSELFGHEKGAFTGAERRRQGRFELAQGGTLFLDEVAELPPQAQAALLRVLQEHTFERVGGEEPIATDARVIAATHRDLMQAVREGSFREDLYYRLSQFTILSPPLRERGDDLLLLADHFVRQAAEELGMPHLGISTAALGKLKEYDWPGNVRELQNVISQCAILAQGSLLEPPHLNLPGESTHVPVQDIRTPVDHFPVPEGLGRLDAAVAREILHALDACSGKVGGRSGAAAYLGLPATTLHSRMKKLGLKGKANT